MHIANIKHVHLPHFPFVDLSVHVAFWYVQHKDHRHQ